MFVFAQCRWMGSVWFWVWSPKEAITIPRRELGTPRKTTHVGLPPLWERKTRAVKAIGNAPHSSQLRASHISLRVSVETTRRAATLLYAPESRFPRLEAITNPYLPLTGGFARSSFFFFVPKDAHPNTGLPTIGMAPDRFRRALTLVSVRNHNSHRTPLRMRRADNRGPLKTKHSGVK